MTPVHCPGHEPAGTEETRQPKPADQIRDDLLRAIDFNYTVGLGYSTPEALLDAYDAHMRALGPGGNET
ncbi:hypothetical protein ACF1BS_03525 [Streptomyces sp. NPDC014748]|uniref:hypothetical protein n=1 Tax=Streptomyces sp. NPDC014748 TaxID=3364905 RepID=UPI0036F92F85